MQVIDGHLRDTTPLPPSPMPGPRNLTQRFVAVIILSGNSCFVSKGRFIISDKPGRGVGTPACGHHIAGSEQIGLVPSAHAQAWGWPAPQGGEIRGATGAAADAGEGAGLRTPAPGAPPAAPLKPANFVSKSLQDRS